MLMFCLFTFLSKLQMAPSCPVDRRPFTNVYRWDGNLGCVQVSLNPTRVIVEDTVAAFVFQKWPFAAVLFVIQHSELKEALF